MITGNVSSIIERRSELYHALAEALSETPSWMLLPGGEWPLTQAVAGLVDHSDAAGKALDALVRTPKESEEARRARYGRLFGGPGRPRFWLYESMWRTGRFLGPELINLEKLYQLMGLDVIGAEAADHASIELAFLAYLSERQASEPGLASKWKQLERSFIKKHSGKWLPALGRSLASSGDEVYGPIGNLMADWIEEAHQPQRRKRKPTGSTHRPMIRDEKLCSLCGFCVQICPTRVLEIKETSHETMLQVSAAQCNGCRKCETTCPSNVLNIYADNNKGNLLDETLILQRSPRIQCPGCGQPTVSQSELDFVVMQLGQQDWLPYCLQCRSNL